ncbi:MAG TPA: HNH endonuclease, partial [Candidatus Butyricicoccus avistercoris]|nr:HNH endonuclease [Candidatus Butyricicoccus avistercoris]
MLLCANMDKLFDNGLITFSNNGKLSVSSILGKDNQSRLNIESGMIFDLKLNENMKEYLEYH